MRLMYLLPAALILLTALHARAGELSPAPGSGAPPSAQPPAEAPQSEVPRSPRDPGMVVEPETVPNPESVIHPPVVDPKMAINPDEMSPQTTDPSEHPNRNRPRQEGMER